jgi:hypothetical protein
MTAARQQQKQRFSTAIGMAGVAFAAFLALTASLPAAKAAGALERVVVDPASGLAISGFDPLAYFSRGQPVQGRPELELRVAGVVWRFENEGNRAAFAEQPEVYGPQFGGYDPVAVGRDTSVAGHPMIWAIKDDRLYLFYDDAARAEFLADPERIIERARQKWPSVAYMISR